MGNFDINTNFNMVNGLADFNSAINNFNKNFEKSISDTKNLSFGDVLNSISEDNQAQKTKEVSPTEKMATDIGSGFKESLMNLNETNKKAENAFETFASGGDISIHEVMIAAQKSSLSMQMALQIRNQLVNAYNEFKNISL